MNAKITPYYVVVLEAASTPMAHSCVNVTRVTMGQHVQRVNIHFIVNDLVMSLFKWFTKLSSEKN